MTLTNVDGHETSRPLRHGEQFGLRVSGPRRCVGVWAGAVRRCPFQAQIPPEATDAQCDACAGADPGRALARDAVRDPRPFRLYLAWFGPELFKVGICAVERQHERLLEQGAVAFTWLAQGDHTAIRAAEQAIAERGLAAERRRRASKLAAWHNLGTSADRETALRTVHAQAQHLRWPARLHTEPFAVADHARLFALDTLPDTLHDITSLTDGAVVAGRVRAVAGPELVLDTNDGTIVLSKRLLTGWPVEATTGAPSGYTTTPLAAVPDEQQALF